jgi:uncharacterized protein YggE
MKKIVATLAILIVATGTFAATIPDFPFVFAQGEATVEVAPDTAKMTFRIKSFHENSSNVVAEVRRRSVEVINFLGKQGFGKGTLVSYELDKSVVRERKNYEELKILGYEATRRFELTINDLSKYETVAKTLFKTDGVTDIETTFGRKDQKRIEGDLLASACADARRYAEGMAKGFQRELGEVHCISKFHFGNIGVAFGLGADSYGGMGGTMACMAGRDEDDCLFIPSTITFQNSVAVIFKMKEE